MNRAVVKADTHVALEYALFDQASGAELTDEPIRVEYVHGYGQVLPALEEGLVGLASGEKKSVVAPPEKAFGFHDDEGVFELEKDGLEGANELEVGEEFVASGPEGDVLMRVLEVRSDTLVVDTNHPLAGKTVRLEVNILQVREATDEEIASAHAEAEADACGCGVAHNHGEHVEEQGEAAELVALKRKPS
jgi:FKBP-type peptidyl-prolyl cis-trans isomerase SlyD